MEPRASQKQKL